MKNWKLINFLLYCGIEKTEYQSVRELIWARNKRTVRITASLSAVLGAVFLVINLIRGVDVLLPYVFLTVGSLAILGVWVLIRNRDTVPLASLICYAEMGLMFVYACILSVSESNYAVPATSVIVFIALLPQSIDDRPVRMYGVMLTESAIYLVLSYFKKAPEAFSLDAINAGTFTFIGMILYAVICTRNVREIFHNERVEGIQRKTVSTLATVVEERDENTGGHISRTEELVRLMTERMRKREAYADRSEIFFRNVVLAAPMHDIGKIKIPDAILNKPGKLTPEEFAVMKKHTAYGADIIAKMMGAEEEKEYRDIAVNIARFHHERYDGNGYPDRLKGEDIPLEARVMALADVYDALISDRVYKKAFTRTEAMATIREGRGTQFDPELTDLFLDLVNELGHSN